jgi:uncharacterized membrane protein YhaH (DUF805 family)
MELSGMLVWAAVLVSLIALIIFLVKGFKGWGAWMTVVFVVLFIEGWCFLFFTAVINQKRLANLKQYDTLLKKVKELEQQKNVLLYGEAYDPKPDLQKYVPLSNELNRVLIERGRAWRGARVAQVNQRSVTFELPSQTANAQPAAPDGVGPGDGAPAAAAVETLKPSDVVYLFSEAEDRVPRAYVGEFRVETVVGSTVTAVPTTVLTPRQLQAVNNSNTWAVYDLLPIDSHVAFANPGSEPTEEEIFGTMDPEAISRLLGIPLELSTRDPNTMSIAEANRARILNAYLRDGTRAPEGTPLESIVYEVEFLKDFELKVDSNITNNAETGGFFNPEGQAVDSRIKREEGQTFVFRANEKDVFKLYGPAAKKLEMEGIVKLGAAIFVRPLNDYNLGLKSTRRLTLKAMDELTVIEREVRVTERSQSITQEELIKAEDKQRRLEADQAQYKLELDRISSEAVRIENELQARRQEAEAIYRDLIGLYNRRTKKLIVPAAN